MKTEVLIVGGGIAGLALASLLGKAGLHITLIEKREFTVEDNHNRYGRTAALMGASINILNALGLWDKIKKRTAPLKSMRIIDDSNPNIPHVQVDFPATDIKRDYFGYNVPNVMLHAMLVESVKDEKNINLLSSTQIKKIKTTDQSVTVTLSDDKTIEATLLVGADGRQSFIRKQANIHAKENDYNQSAITCLIEHTKSHEFISTEHHRTGGPFTTVPMPDKDDKHYSSIVWVEKTEDSERYIKMDKNSLENAIEKRARNALGKVKLASTPESWPLKGIIAEQITAPRTALIAEAAHAMSPIGAQGLNLSLRDVASLSEVLIDAARLGENIGNELVLKRYANRRHLDITSRFSGVDSYNKIVSNNVSILRGLRRSGLRALKTVPAFKNFAMQHGLTPSLDEGRLMRGEAL